MVGAETVDDVERFLVSEGMRELEAARVEEVIGIGSKVKWVEEKGGLEFVNLRKVPWAIAYDIFVSRTVLMGPCHG